MTVSEIAHRLGLKRLVDSNPSRIVRSGYVCDRLSRAMVKAPADAAWITIASHANVAAVALLADVSLILLAEDEVPHDMLIARAKQHGLNLYSSHKSAFTLAFELSELLSESHRIFEP